MIQPFVFTDLFTIFSKSLENCILQQYMELLPRHQKLFYLR
ncbi:hypothetical protein QW060_24680 [Myroides ceti]|uniref:Maturase K n=1 Tax=Paenimyroides ceti TaxID=395087 RepID=A0ABT8D2F8_9FLAO|nr:hypothetical protein [Paenimyroides ceti]MDN3710093.1 hypothetical protein [Paenimyroides ceti]